jgi:hypothetical protein
MTPRHAALAVLLLSAVLDPWSAWAGSPARIPVDAGTVAGGESRPSLEPGQVALVARVLELDDRQRDLVARLLALAAPERRRLEFLLSLQGIALVTADGRVLDRGAREDRFAWDLPGAVTPVLGTVTLDDVYTLLTTVQAKVTTISGSVSTLLGRIPDGSGFQPFADQIDLTDLQGMLDILHDELGGIVAMAQELRTGFEQFDAADFRSKVHKLLGDVATAWEEVQRLECIELPDRGIRQLRTTLLDNLVDKAPDVALFGLSRVLDVTGEDWPNLVSDVTALIPQELTQPGFCGGALEAPPAEVCSVLRKDDVRRGVKRVTAAARAGGFAVKLARSWTTDDKVASVGVDVVAGAEAGTNVKNPANGVLETAAKVLERITKVGEKIQDTVEKCAMQDDAMEAGLRDCKPPRGVFLAGRTRPTFQEVAALVTAWVDEADGVLDAARVARARADVAATAGQEGTPLGYARLCDAYNELVFAGTKDQRTLRKQLRKQKVATN